MLLSFALLLIFGYSRQKHSKNNWDFGYEADLVDAPFEAVASMRDDGEEKVKRQSMKTAKRKLYRLFKKILQKELDKETTQRHHKKL